MSFLGIILLLFGIVFLIWFVMWARFSGKVKVIGDSPEVLGFLKGKTNKLWYFAHFKYGVSSQLNSGAALKCNKKKYRPIREIMHGVDGGEFALDWFTPKGQADPEAKDDLQNDAPILVLEHGMGGGSGEPYVQKIGLRARNELKWRAVCVIFRGCCGMRLTTAKIYHAGYTEDFHIALSRIHSQYPDAPIMVVGYSMGGNMIAKYLSEQQSSTTVRVPANQVSSKSGIVPGIICAAAVGNPFNLTYVMDHYSEEEKLILGKGLIHYLEKHLDAVKFKEGMDKSVEEFYKKNDYKVNNFDDYFTSKLMGYKDGRDYYSDNGCAQYLDGLKTPVLFINAKNDPVSLYGAIPSDTLSHHPYASCLVTPGGGHLGFFSFCDTMKTFDEEIVIMYLKYKLDEWNKKKGEGKKEE